MGSLIQSGKLGPKLGRGTEFRSASLSWRCAGNLGDLSKQRRVGEDTNWDKRKLSSGPAGHSSTLKVPTSPRVLETANQRFKQGFIATRNIELIILNNEIIPLAMRKELCSLNMYSLIREWAGFLQSSSEIVKNSSLLWIDPRTWSLLQRQGFQGNYCLCGGPAQGLGMRPNR